MVIVAGQVALKNGLSIMAIEYVNRRGDRYYLLQGKTKSGKPKYYVSRKADGIPVDQMPEEYEIYENPERGLVTVRKKRPSKILPAEQEMLTRWTAQFAEIKYFSIDIQDDSLVVYAPENDPGHAVRVISKLFGAFPNPVQEEDWIGHHATYLPLFRFTLYEEEKRLFAVERWCFRGGIDDWFPLSGVAPLEVLAKKYLPHLNRESYYELM